MLSLPVHKWTYENCDWVALTQIFEISQPIDSTYCWCLKWFTMTFHCLQPEPWNSTLTPPFLLCAELVLATQAFPARQVLQCLSRHHSASLASWCHFCMWPQKGDKAWIRPAALNQGRRIGESLQEWIRCIHSSRELGNSAGLWGESVGLCPAAQKADPYADWIWRCVKVGVTWQGPEKIWSKLWSLLQKCQH